MRHDRRFQLCACILIAFVAGCAKKSSPTDATLEAGVYSNRFFGLRVEIPKGWTVANKEVFERAKETGTRLIAKDKDTEAVLKASEERTKQLLLISERPFGAAVEMNRSIVIAAEDLSGAPGVQTGKDYHYHTLKLLTGPGKRFQQLNEPYKVLLGPKEFYRVDLSASVMGRDFQQAYFAAVEKNNALLLVTTAESGEKIDAVLLSAGLPQKKL